MLNRIAPQLCCLTVLLALTAAGPVRAQTNDTALPGVQTHEPAADNGDAVTVPASKGDRLPINTEPLEGADIPRLQPMPTDAKDGKPAVAPVSVFDRMGVPLPDLPKEKPFAGKPDEAYGAFQRGMYLTALELALPRAQTGDAAAQTLVAEILSNGLGVPRKPADAAFWYGQAANAGDPAGMFKYALLLMEGRDVKRDKAKSEEFMKKAAERGNASAQFNYAQMLVGDMPGEKGLKAALPFYEKSAEQGIADAQYALSQIYLNIDGIDEQKRQRAREWLLRAARAGYDTAQLDLAIWLVDGVGGAKDLDNGFKWMRRAALGGNVIAQNKLAHLYVNAIGTRPDPVEAAKWYILSRRAGLKDPSLEDFYLGLEEVQQKAAINAANKNRPS